ncbi:MAG: hypothetical protein OXC62_08410 [Aestuariivita sp.]|nr:hypothetical protein [Aestuariivita sp.]
MSQTQMSTNRPDENETSSIWPVLGGALLCGGAAATLPLTGPGAILALLYGTGTIVATGGAVGAAAGAAVAMNKKSYGNGYSDGYNDGSIDEKTKWAKEKEILARRVEEFKAKIQADSIAKDHYFDVVLALVSVGVSAAYADFEVCTEERRTIEQFVAGMSVSQLPTNIKNKIEKIIESPPNLQTAYEHAQKARVPMELCEEVIKSVISADNEVNTKERAFLIGWRRLAAA